MFGVSVVRARGGYGVRVGTRVGIQGGYTRVGTGRAIPVHPARCCEEVPLAPSEAGPGSPKGTGVGGVRDRGLQGTVFGGGDGYIPPSGPGQALQGLPWIYPWNAASGPIRRDYMTFPIKLVKTVKCHQKVSKRPVIVPISQNRRGKSPLGILGFPFPLAFSRKELMGHFDACG